MKTQPSLKIYTAPADGTIDLLQCSGQCISEATYRILIARVHLPLLKLRSSRSSSYFCSKYVDWVL